MKVGLCIIDVKDKGRHIGVARLHAHQNEGDMRAKVAKFMGVIAQDVEIFPLCYWDLSEGGGMCGLLEIERVAKYVEPADLHKTLADQLDRHGYKLEVRIADVLSGDWHVMEVPDGAE